MENEFQKMQRLAGVPVTEDKKQLNENFVGLGMVGNIFDREKADYELAYEHYLGNLNEVEEDTDGEENPIDSITMDVPLFIRMLEFAREDASTDMDLHNLAEKAITMSAEGEILSMDNYESLVGGETEELNEGSNNKMENYLTDLFDSIDLGDEYEEGPQSYTFEKMEWADEDLYGDEAEMFEPTHEYISSRKTINIKDPKSGTPLTFRTEGENIVVDFNTEDFPLF